MIRIWLLAAGLVLGAAFAAAAHDEKYSKLINGHLARHRMRPGIKAATHAIETFVSWTNSRATPRTE